MQHPTRPTSSPAVADALAGTQYRVVRQIGAGGWGTVYEAEHRELRKRFAVKVLLPNFGADRLSIERMRVEARALGRLRSPHIVEASDFGYTEDGRPFLVMPLLVGKTLREVVRERGWLPVGEAVDLVQQLLAALAVAHDAGFVHRDIKLDNLFLCDLGDGRRVLKLLDFGIAKVLPGAGLGATSEPAGVQTQDGAVMGTPRFIPPEQALGAADIGPPADLYGVGVIAYELLTGSDPFAHVAGFAPLLRAHVTEEPLAPSAVASEPIDPALEAVILRALAKRPEDRYASAATLSAAFADALAEAVVARRQRTVPSFEAEATHGVSVGVACLVVVASAFLSALVAAALVHGS